MLWCCLHTSQGMLRCSNSLPREDNDPSGTPGNFQRVCLNGCFFPPTYFSQEGGGPAKALLWAAIIHKMHRASRVMRVVPGAEMKEHRGSLAAQWDVGIWKSEQEGTEFGILARQGLGGSSKATSWDCWGESFLRYPLGRHPRSPHCQDPALRNCQRNSRFWKG